MNKLVALALDARTRADVASLEAALSDTLAGARYRFVDDNPGNWSSVTSGAEPTALLFERVTNMFDAEIEYHARNLGDRSWESPSEAVADLYDLPDGVDGLPPAARGALAKDAVMALHDSDDSKQTPTITFRDHGTGLTGQQMPRTILSLNKSPKLSNRWAHGVFGKGGTTASQYGDATIIITRRQPDMLQPGELDIVSVAVMKKAKDPGYRMPFLHYLVDENDKVFSVPATEAADFEPGTYIAHVNYHLGQAGVETWKHDQSIYAYAETVLFRPVLPYSLHDARSDDANTRPETRRRPSTLAGLGRRLDKHQSDTIIDHGDLGTVTVGGVGTVRLCWWLFEDQSARRRSAARRYSVLFLSNGQTHQAWDQQRLQLLIPERRRVGERLVVEVDCDAIDVMMRVELFTSDRNSMRNSPEGKALEAQVVEVISADPTLAEHEDEFVRKALRTGAKGVNEAFLERLNRAIKLKSSGLKMERGGGLRSTSQTPPPPAPVELLYPEPTYLEGPEKVTALLGKTARVYLKANAEDGFVPSRATLTVTPETDAPALTPNIGTLRNGRMVIGLQVPAGAETGTYVVNFAITWSDARGNDRRLDWDTKIEIVAEIKPKSTGSKQKPGDKGEVAFMWSHSKDQSDWTDNTAGDLQFLSGSVLADDNPKTYGHLRKIAKVPTVVLNQDFKDWATYRQKITAKRGDKQVEARTTRYGIAVGSAVADICGNEGRLIRLRENDRNADEPMSQEQQQRAVTAAARTALVLLPDLDVISPDGADDD